MGGMNGWDHMGGWGGMGGASGWGWVFLVLLLVGVAAVVVALVRLRTAGRGEQSPGAAGRPSARQILDERFARGEIDADEYQQRVRQLEDR